MTKSIAADAAAADEACSLRRSSAPGSILLMLDLVGDWRTHELVGPVLVNPVLVNPVCESKSLACRTDGSSPGFPGSLYCMSMLVILETVGVSHIASYCATAGGGCATAGGKTHGAGDVNRYANMAAVFAHRCTAGLADLFPQN